jgi:hypothetical protein
MEARRSSVAAELLSVLEKSIEPLEHPRCQINLIRIAPVRRRVLLTVVSRKLYLFAQSSKRDEDLISQECRHDWIG